MNRLYHETITYETTFKIVTCHVGLRIVEYFFYALEIPESWSHLKNL
jgi:hypothetical protein